MKLTQLNIENFRNIEKMNIEPCDKVNVIFGENAQGKTNILEAIWLFTGCRSFRGTKDKELITFDKDRAELSVGFFSEGREQYMNITIDEKRKISKNGIAYPSCAKAVGEFICVVFSPAHLSLIKQGPAERRKFADIAISQLKPNYALLLTEYNRAVRQRNFLLRDAAFHSEIYDTLDIWEDRIAHYASKIAKYRLSYIDKLREEVTGIYRGISSNKEEIELEYVQSEDKKNFTSKEEYRERLKKARKEDMASGSTSVGIHRDDIEIKINGVSVRKFGSQGQQRSVALALKLGEAGVIKSVTGEQPVALLDDVMSELDISRQDYILNRIRDWQVFITCCDPNTIKHLKEGKSFEIEKGRIKDCG
ncbi:MAG: DNA replication/repair protein RecF [Acutalibacteraceae bacterium]|nr:DNA replication/repair protein RecF [Oscillospiraceae bacterium]